MLPAINAVGGNKAPPSAQEVEQLCQVLFTSADAAQRTQAEKALMVLKEPEYFRHCQYLLEASASPFVQMIAASSLTKCFSTSFQRLNRQQRLAFRDAIIAHIGNRGLSLPEFAANALMSLLGRVVKCSWIGDPEQHDILEPIKKFFQVSPAHAILGMQLLNFMVQEINQDTPGLTSSQHRKVAIAFRDKALLDITTLALNTLRQLALKVAPPNTDDDRMRGSCLTLLHKCFSFDFLGTAPDDSGDDSGTIQAPGSWHEIFVDTTLLDFLFQLYSTLPPGRATQVMDVLVLMASVRRSLFLTDEERDKYLLSLMQGMRNVLSTQVGLADAANHHSFCRLLLRFKGNYQLHQIIALDVYTEWVQLVANFSIASFRSWELMHSHYYLLQLWSRLVASTYYMRGPKPTMMEDLAPKVCEAFVTSRLELVPALLSSAATAPVENPLDDEDQLNEMLEPLPYLGRCRFAETSAHLVALFDPLAAAFEKHLVTGDQNALVLVQEQLAWLSYVIGAIVGGRLGVNTTEDYDQFDGELSARVFQLMALLDAAVGRLSRPLPGSERLETAMMYFIQQFRKVYIGDQAMASSKVYERLGERLGLSDHVLVLNFIITKIGGNLKHWYSNRGLVEKTLDLFHDLGSGYSSSKVLIRIEQIQQVFQHHTSQYFPFLDHPENSRCRTIFYTSLSRLLFMEENISQFEAFMLPFKDAFQNIMNVASSYEAMRAPACKRAVIGLLRDLIGIAVACSTRRQLTLLFEWLYPARTPLLSRIAEAFYDTPEVTTPLLKFFHELVWNKQGRLSFDCTSANGILLFREAAALLKAYGPRLLTLSPQPTEVYALKYKGTWLCMSMLMRALTGQYVNFGVFALYNDPALSNALEVCTQLLLSVPLDDLMAYPKLQRAYFSVTEAICDHHFQGMLVHLDPHKFAHLLMSLKSGIRSTDGQTTTMCCASLDSIATFYFLNAAKGQNIAQHLQFHPDLIPSILLDLFESVLEDEIANQWSISRPLFSLSLLYPNGFARVKEDFARRAPERQADVLRAFEELMSDVTLNLENRNRDKFTQNVGLWRHELRSIIS